MILGITRKKMAAYKSRFMRGSSYLGIFLSLFTFAGLTKLLGINISFFILSIIGVIAYFGGCYLVGYIDENKGIWKEENEYAYAVTPMSQELYDKINFVYKKMGGK